VNVFTGRQIHTVSNPNDKLIFYFLEVTALFPMLALIFTKKLRPTIIGSLSLVDVFG
jgi:hypothetical protein